MAMTASRKKHFGLLAWLKRSLHRLALGSIRSSVATAVMLATVVAVQVPQSYAQNYTVNL